MKFKLLLIAWLLLTEPAAAGWWADWWDGFCEKHIACADPYQFEQAPDWFIRREIQDLLAQLSSRGHLTRTQTSILRVLREELRLRQAALPCSHDLGQGQTEAGNDNKR